MIPKLNFQFLSGTSDLSSDNRRLWNTQFHQPKEMFYPVDDRCVLLPQGFVEVGVAEGEGNRGYD